ncbi:bifunctional tetrahydrofolate synthase/dihydrofolate synthase [Saccharospirillum mangrovi]|uniref:bifunctional tetrahydrofolate synthase/dihydrofolate synthase n=1 Tax=Saccharospirillum mangrovi TaxID=2161747 RepID=UPI000D3D8931|nr:bifunctional tetrahydrofolate synthase/dihydrofolate synthase [Saccharospirillum mangrovi]
MPKPPEGASLFTWLDYLEHLHGQTIDMGLDRVRLVADRLNLPLSRDERNRPFVFTVAGTNGKGSTCATLHQLSRVAGLSVGLYTSPHLHRFNERVVINQDMASDDDLIRAFEQVEAARGDVSLTYFEFTTLAAFVLFNDADLDVWVLEIGLGGRLDAVNLVDADISVLTTVDRDHQAFLGDDLEQIGREKAGVFRAGQPAVLGSAELPMSVQETAKAVGAQLFPFGAEHGADDTGLWWRGSRLPEGRLRATVPRANQAAALQAFALSPFEVSPADAERAVNQVSIPGRMQTLTVAGRRVVLDVGHNPHAARYLAQRLGHERWSVVFGMLADKDVESVTQALNPIVGGWYLAGLAVPRGLSAETLAGRATAAVGQCYHSVAAALEAALDDPAGRPVLVCGSFYTVAEALEALAAFEPEWG